MDEPEIVPRMPYVGYVVVAKVSAPPALASLEVPGSVMVMGVAAMVLVA